MFNLVYFIVNVYAHCCAVAYPALFSVHFLHKMYQMTALCIFIVIDTSGWAVLYLWL